MGLTVIAGAVSGPQLQETFATGVRLVHGGAVPHGLDADRLAELLAAPVPAR